MTALRWSEIAVVTYLWLVILVAGVSCAIVVGW